MTLNCKEPCLRTPLSADSLREGSYKLEQVTQQSKTGILGFTSWVFGA